MRNNIKITKKFNSALLIPPKYEHDKNPLRRGSCEDLPVLLASIYSCQIRLNAETDS